MPAGESACELTAPGWQQRSKLIGYGVFALVFHPPFLLPNEQSFSTLSKQIEENPDGYVGFITTADHYHDELQKSTELLKRLCGTVSGLSNFTVFPMCDSADFKPLSLRSREVGELVERFHAVRKKVEYEGTWKDKSLIQLIYPYAGKPLAAFYKKRQNSPGWPAFFQAMSDIVQLLTALHERGYVHGDLSPNNLLFDQNGQRKFTIVDWSMLCSAEHFLKQAKGASRVGCWSPEHFSLTSSRLKDFEEDRYWLIYAEEMQKYIQRLLDFSFANGSSPAAAAVREYFEPYLSQPEPSAFHAMYEELRVLAHTDPSAIGKYHDIRYLMDTIAKTVSHLFPDRTVSQQNHYNAFLALCLAQNLSDRIVYLKNPSRLIRRLSLILHSCATMEGELISLNDEAVSEATLMRLLQ